MSSSLNESNLEKKFQSVTNTQDSIQTLSLWILHHKTHHTKIVEIWMKVLKKAKMPHRLTLFYLANDVIQNSRRKGIPQFKESFGEVLKEATLLVRDDLIRPSVERVFTIWGERNVYSSDFISDLQSILDTSKSSSTRENQSSAPYLASTEISSHKKKSTHRAPDTSSYFKRPKAQSHQRNEAKQHYSRSCSNSSQKGSNAKVPTTAPSKLLAEFKCHKVIEKIRKVIKIEVETAEKQASVNLSKLNATNAEILRQLKDRTHGQQFSKDFEEASKCLEGYITCLENEIKERTQLIELLEQSEIYYDTQRGEAKIVANAYKNFGGRVKALQKKLEELKSTLPVPSPQPSPCPDAPSPTTSEVEMDFNPPGGENKVNDTAEVSEEVSNEAPVKDSSVENVPSPEGTPEGLNISPVVKQSPVKTTSTKPVPVLSSFFPQEPGVMTSWLGAFTTKSNSDSKPAFETQVAETSSLESRLSNLMQNITNLPSTLPSTIFGSQNVGGLTPKQESLNSPITFTKASLGTPNRVNPGNIEPSTPVKDEHSEQNTPVQDEDSHSSGSNFFSRLSSLSKPSQSPQDIFKGLTSLIQSSSTNIDTTALQSTNTYSDNQKNNLWLSENFETSNQSKEPKTNISEFLKKISPSLNVQGSPHSLSPHRLVSSPSHTFTSGADATRHHNSNSRTPVTSSDNYPPQTIPFSPLSNTFANLSHSYSDTRPSAQELCPTSRLTSAVSSVSGMPLYTTSSVPLSTGSNGSAVASSNEYDPEGENFEPMDMDLGDSDAEFSPGKLGDDTPASPDADDWDDNSMPDPHEQNESALISVLPKDNSSVISPDGFPDSIQTTLSFLGGRVLNETSDISSVFGHLTRDNKKDVETENWNKASTIDKLKDLLEEGSPFERSSNSGEEDDLPSSEAAFKTQEPSLPCVDKDDREPYNPSELVYDEQHSPTSNGENEEMKQKNVSSEKPNDHIPETFVARIETVQSVRKDTDKRRWSEEEWEYQEFAAPSQREDLQGNTYRQNYYERIPSEHFNQFNRRSSAHGQRGFRGGNNWRGRDRHFNPYGSPPKRFPHPVFRGNRGFRPPRY